VRQNLEPVLGVGLNWAVICESIERVKVLIAAPFGLGARWGTVALAGPQWTGKRCEVSAFDRCMTVIYLSELLSSSVAYRLMPWITWSGHTVK
jgi:hypothetical protein